VELVNLVENRLFILLKVTGVGQWQALKGSHETGKITNETPCLAAGKLSDVRVLFCGMIDEPVEKESSRVT